MGADRMTSVDGDHVPGQRGALVQLAQQRRELGTSLVLGPIRRSAITAQLPWVAAASR
jgi:hypothetical protein